ncbi:hypothetical protein LTR84_008053 [Exophiala bonariae]|uniref:5'-3' DNA helicase ZGRF1-like N-terminal domain-containing protein n=1 Tax=Exophiala bonariae TaxID=1690606 RepID=A0AAV9NLX2_9EURO|nr:hypothetical protein LTR84_008053 [Exophiala bonariae]
MSTLTCTPMSTPNLTVAPTQNTAPVHEYQCLYTRDLHKKAKKWHDGSLRFHTFNQRVMVYDDSKNFIGDLHYRDTEPFGEGVEVQLDRGVKVEVGQLSGRSETDLSTILERPRTEQPAQPSKLLPSQTSQRPKSLIEVLGPSQRRNGRSRLPLQSPYEQRQSLNVHHPATHPAKRPRLSAVKENHQQADVNPNKISRSDGTPQSFPPTLAASSILPSRLPQRPMPSSSICFEEVIDILSDEDAPSRPLAPSKARSVRQTTSEAPTPAAAPSKAVITKPNLQSKPARKGKPAHPTGIKQKTRLKDTQERPQSETSRVSMPPRLPEARFARLLLPQHRPREKLTCVLSGSPGHLLSRRPSIASTASSESPQESVHSPILVDTSSPEIDISATSKFQIDLSAQRTPKNVVSKCSPIPVDRSASCSSPLFVPEDHPRAPSPSPAVIASPNIASANTIEASPSTESNRIQSRDPIFHNDSRETRGPIVAGFEMSQTQPEQDESATSLLHAGPVSFPIAHSPPRSLRRTYSASNAFEDEALSKDLGDITVPRSPLTVLENLSSRRSPVKRKSPAKLSRCASDTAAMTSHTNVSVQQQLESIPKDEIGPWTSEESFILFDWWPSALETPDLWKFTTKVLQPVKSLPPIPDFSARITTARQLLNDIR